MKSQNPSIPTNLKPKKKTHRRGRKYQLRKLQQGYSDLSNILYHPTVSADPGSQRPFIISNVPFTGKIVIIQPEYKLKPIDLERPFPSLGRIKTTDPRFIEYAEQSIHKKIGLTRIILIQREWKLEPIKFDTVLPSLDKINTTDPRFLHYLEQHISFGTKIEFV